MKTRSIAPSITTESMIPATAFPFPSCFFLPAEIRPKTENNRPNTLVIPKRNTPRSDRTNPAEHIPLPFALGSRSAG